MPTCPYLASCKLREKDAEHDDKYTHPDEEVDDTMPLDREIEVLTKPLPEPPRSGNSSPAMNHSTSSSTRAAAPTTLSSSSSTRHPAGFDLCKDAFTISVVAFIVFVVRLICVEAYLRQYV